MDGMKAIGNNTDANNMIRMICNVTDGSGWGGTDNDLDYL